MSLGREDGEGEFDRTDEGACAVIAGRHRLAIIGDCPQLYDRHRDRYTGHQDTLAAHEREKGKVEFDGTDEGACVVLAGKRGLV